MPQFSAKRLAISKDNTTMVIAVGVAAFIVVFSLVASKALLEQRSYQAKVIGKKKIALKQLKTNISEVEKLNIAYEVFASAPQNVLGGNPTGNGEKDGENSRLVLDALPSKYDFPALTTSIEKLFKQYTLVSIEGIDDEVAQAENQVSGSPMPVEMPFALSVSTPATNAKPMLQLFERSIRPIQVQNLTLKGDAADLKITVNGITYFQPEKNFKVKTEVVK